MYTSHFGFDSKPFKSKDPKDFYRNANFDAACADILDGIRERRGFILLTGEAGIGKTFVLRRCMAEADDIRFVLLNNANLNFPDLLNYLCGALELPATHLNTEQQGQRLLDTLVAYARRNQTIALLIDDAHHLRADALCRLWEFVEVPSLPSQRLQVVLAGLPEIEGKLRQYDLQLIQDSIEVRCHLERLSTLETGLFISHQFTVAGLEVGDLLSPAVIDRIATHSQGAPRAIAMLCDAILLFASLESNQRVTPELVDDVARDCFLGARSERPIVETQAPRHPVSTAATPMTDDDLDDLELGLPDLDFTFDFDPDQTAVSELSAGESPAVAIPDFELEPATVMTPEPPVEPAFAPLAEFPEPIPEPIPQSLPEALLPASPPLRAFAQLLEETVAKQDRHDVRDRAALRFFHYGYLRLLQGTSRARLTECEWRLARLAQIQQPVVVMLAVAIRAAPRSSGVLCALLINPTWWQYREIRLQVRSPDLSFANAGQAISLRLLGGRDAHPVYLEFHGASAGSTQAGLRLEIELRDHRGEWQAYVSRREIRLDLPLRREDGRKVDKVLATDARPDCFWPEPEGAENDAAAGIWLLNESAALTTVGGLADTLPLELEVDAERTQRLRATTVQTLVRGTPLTRALLLSADPAQAPARIELVSRPFMVLGRYNAVTGMGFGDFALGFVPKYNRISRLHGVICALGDQLALMPASNQGYTYMGRNGVRLERGCWEFLETGDALEICGLYRLRLTLSWDQRGERDPPGWDPAESREKFGHYLLDLVDELQQRDSRTNTDETQAPLRSRYLNLLRMQERVAVMNGVGSPGALLYARFEREDEAGGRQVVHYYLPKWLSLGSDPQAGLRITAAGVAPQQAELLLRDGMYWIQNLAGPGSVRVGCHGLATNEVIALEAGDVLGIGSARFTFEAY